jgi:hypothetical protein
VINFADIALLVWVVDKLIYNGGQGQGLPLGWFIIVSIFANKLASKAFENIINLQCLSIISYQVIS